MTRLRIIGIGIAIVLFSSAALYVTMRAPDPVVSVGVDASPSASPSERVFPSWSPVPIFISPSGPLVDAVRNGRHYSTEYNTVAMFIDGGYHGLTRCNKPYLQPEDCVLYAAISRVFPTGHLTEEYYSTASEAIVTTDLNGDGNDDVVVIADYNGGGTGHFINLESFINDGHGNIKHIASAPLGDRTIIRGMEASGNRITVYAVVHQSGDAGCCGTRPLKAEYVYENGRLSYVGKEPFYPYDW